MITKIIIIFTMIIIAISLGISLIFLIRDSGTTKRSVKALSVRIGVSLSLFIFLFIAFKLGLIKPHSI